MGSRHTRKRDRRALGWDGSGSGFPNNCRLVSGMVVRRPVDRNGINLGTRGLNYVCVRGRRSFRLRACGRPVISFEEGSSHLHLREASPDAKHGKSLFYECHRLTIPPKMASFISNLSRLGLDNYSSVSFFFCTRFWRGCHGGLMNGRSCVCVALEMDGTCVGE